MINRVTVSKRTVDDDITVVEVRGEIDVFTSPKVKETFADLLKEGKTSLVIDLVKVSYIDSTGLGVLIGALKGAREKGGSINLVCTNPQIRRILEITGLVKLFSVFEAQAPAVEELRSRVKVAES